MGTAFRGVEQRGRDLPVAVEVRTTRTRMRLSPSRLCPTLATASRTSAARVPTESASWLTLWILDETSRAASAVWPTLRAISCVAAPCSSIAAAMADATSSTSRIRSPISATAFTAASVAAWISPT
jgi:hypothetical protein